MTTPDTLAKLAAICEEIALKHQQDEGTYAAGKKAGALECAEAIRALTAQAPAAAEPTNIGFDEYWEARRLETWREMGCDEERGPTPSKDWGEGYKKPAKHAYQAAQQAAQAPEGWVLVPEVLTPEMLDVDEEVGGHCYSCTKWKASADDCNRIWRAMLEVVAARPQAEGSPS